MSELYPIKFLPVYKEKVWGGNRLKNVLRKNEATGKTGESWEISGVKGSISVVDNGFLAGNELDEIIEVYMGDLVGERVFDTFGTTFPLLFKFIDANDVLSVQVHPDDELAMRKHQSTGKSEIWYVIDGTPEAFVYTGLNKEMTPDEFRTHIDNNTVKEVLNRESAKRGDVFYMPAGRIHATGAGVLFAEIQQTSDITYRVYDWNRKDQNGKLRQLHVEDALEALNYEVQADYRTHYQSLINQRNPVKSSPFFVLNKLLLTQPFDVNYHTIDSFVVLMCMGGKGEIIDQYEHRVTIGMGETLLIPAVLENIKIIPDGEVELLEVHMPAD